jgi:hypothetical protein
MSNHLFQIDKHFASRSSPSRASSSSFPPSLYRLRDIITEGKLHIRSGKPPTTNKSGAGRNKKRKLNDGSDEESEVVGPPEEIAVRLIVAGVAASTD